MTTSRHGGRILVDQLVTHGCERVFLVPGESFLAVLDGLVDAPEIDTIVCRQEGGAAIMAEALGKLTGRPGVCFATRAPGAANASAGVHIAFQDSTPMILFIGQVARSQRDREAFQEVDYRQMFAPLAKWAAQIDDVRRIPEYISHAYHLATSGRPGPVVLALPEDVLSEQATVADGKPYAPVLARCSLTDAESAAELLQNADRPLIIVGGPGWSAQTADQIGQFAQRNNLPVAASFRCQDYLDNAHANYIGDLGLAVNSKLAERVQAADLLLVIGARLGEMTTSGYRFVDIPCPRQKLIHVYPGADELGRVYRPDLAVNAASASFIDQLAGMRLQPSRDWPAWLAPAREDYLTHIKPLPTPGRCQLAKVIEYLRDILPADAIVTNGAGNYTAWVHRYYQYRSYKTQLAPTSGSMGYGAPAAVAAKLQYPQKIVLSFAGDGCYLMHGQELATAVQYGANIIVVVVNNGMYGTIRMHQERQYPSRVSATNLVNPDFAALARSYHAHGEKVVRTEEFPEAFARAQASGKPAVIELQVDPQALTPQATLSEIRQAALTKNESL